MTEAPPATSDRCTCTWSGNGQIAFIYIADPHCPSWPHPRIRERGDWRGDE